MTPVIDNTTSILSFPQWEQWSYQLSASNNPYVFTLASGSLPPGMSLQPRWAATGAHSTSLFTTSATSNFKTGTPLVFASYGGGGTTSIAVNTIYYVINPSSSTFQLAATPGGAALTFSADITPAQLYQPGLITGAAIMPGIWNARITATNTDPATSDSALFTIGIEAGASSADSNTDLVWDMGTNDVTLQTSSAITVTETDRTKPMIYVKEGDGLILRLRLVKDGTIIFPNMTEGGLKLIVKEYEPDGQIIIGGGAAVTTPTAYDMCVQNGSSDSSVNYMLYVSFTGLPLKSALDNYESDDGTRFNALAELEFTFVNPEGVGPTPITRTSKTFAINIERDLGGLS